MKTITPLILLTAGCLTVSAKVNIIYDATLLDQGKPANGVYDIKFTLFEKSNGGAPVGIVYTNLHLHVTNGTVRSGLLCRNDSVSLKRGWVEAAIRAAGTDGQFIPLRARVDTCRVHRAEPAKSCDDRCEFVQLRLHTFRLPFEFDPAQPRRGRGFLHLPENLSAKRTTQSPPAR